MDYLVLLTLKLFDTKLQQLDSKIMVIAEPVVKK